MSQDEKDITFEPIPGLPETLPAGEEILWQGRPSTWALAKSAFGLTWIMGYFVLLAAWRGLATAADGTVAEATGAAVLFLLIGAVVSLLLLGMAWIQVRNTLYTLTSHRVVMRVGAALTLTLNLPFNQILSAGLDLRRSGIGTIALQTKRGPSRLSYLALWPHVRPWRMRITEPALRCIPEAQRVAELLAEAAETRVSQPTVAPVSAPAAVAAE